jgi:hypothetical protein
VATELTPENQAHLDVVVKRVRHYEETLGSHYSNGLWSRMDRLFHGWTRLRSALRDTRGPNRRDVLEDARDEFGHELFIPHAYAIVETVLPALLSNRPRILILPNGEASTRNVENMKAIIDKQQGNISLELRLQEVVKEALIYGIGVGKTYWLRREGKRPQLQELSRIHPARLLGHTHTVETVCEPLFDDPTFEHVRARDFGWDPFAANMESAAYAYHRSWRPTEYVLGRLADPAGWTQTVLTPEDLESNNGSAGRYQQSVRSSFEAQAIPVPSPTGQRERDIHEVIEYHDRGQCITVLDRQWVVSVVPNETNYGRLPFHIYRPTHVPGQMVGKGEIEPIEDLQREMNMMRTDRRWADLMALNPVLFYNDGLIEPDKIKVGPGELNPVNGDPRHHLAARPQAARSPRATGRRRRSRRTSSGPPGSATRSPGATPGRRDRDGRPVAACPRLSPDPEQDAPRRDRTDQAARGALGPPEPAAHPPGSATSAPRRHRRSRASLSGRGRTTCSARTSSRGTWISRSTVAARPRRTCLRCARTRRS